MYFKRPFELTSLGTAFLRLPKNTQGVLWMILATFVLATVNVVVKHLTNDYSVIQLVWARYIFHMVLVVAFLRSKFFKGFITNNVTMQMSRSALLATGTVLYFAGLVYIQIAEASSSSFIIPVLVTALAAPFLGEKVGLRRWIGVLIGAIGALIIIRPGMGLMHIAILFPFGTAFVHAFYQILTRKLSGTDSAITTLAYTAVVGTVLSSLAAPFYWSTPDLEGWVLMAIIGILGGLGHYFLIRAYEHAQAPVVAPFFYTHFLWTTLFGVTVFGDLPDMWTFIGAGIIFMSGLYIHHRESVRRVEVGAP
jgi:drug/metabolite transporter (DMT)-like permease